MSNITTTRKLNYIRNQPLCERRNERKKKSGNRARNGFVGTLNTTEKENSANQKKIERNLSGLGKTSHEISSLCLSHV